MPAPTEGSIRAGNARFDTYIPQLLMERIELVAKYLSLTKRSALIILLDEACSHYERRQEDARQAIGIHHP